MRKFTLSLAIVAVSATLVAGCSSEPAEESTPDRTASAAGSASADTTPSPTPSSVPPAASPTAPSTPAPSARPALEVSIHGKEVLPNAQSITVKAGRALVVSVESDRAGELHVHSKPEQYVEFEEGVSTTRLVIKTPGSVEIEDHETGAVVALLTVEK